jgi:hypothetical protein
MEQPVSFFERVIFFIDASAYKATYKEDSIYADRYPAICMAYFWCNIVYWPLRWLKIGSHTNLYILMAIVPIEIVLHIAFADKIKAKAENYYNYYNKVLYTIFVALLIAFTLWNVYYMFTNV